MTLYTAAQTAAERMSRDIQRLRQIEAIVEANPDWVRSNPKLQELLANKLAYEEFSNVA